MFWSSGLRFRVAHWWVVTSVSEEYSVGIFTVACMYSSKSCYTPTRLGHDVITQRNLHLRETQTISLLCSHLYFLSRSLQGNVCNKNTKRTLWLRSRPAQPTERAISSNVTNRCYRRDFWYWIVNRRLNSGLPNSKDTLPVWWWMYSTLHNS
jgi:hypothetical protein